MICPKFFIFGPKCKDIGISRSFVEHLFVLLQIYLKFLVSPVLSIDRGNIPNVSDSTVVVLLEFVLIGFDFLTELPTLFLYIGDYALDPLLRHLLTPAPIQRFFQLLVVDVEWSQWLLLVMIGLPFEVDTEIAIVAFELVLYFFLFV